MVPSPPIYVDDGSECTINRDKGICINRRCEKLNEIINPNKLLNKCISEINSKELSFKLCSDNGVCDNLQKCNCNENWSGKYCENYGENNNSAHRPKLNSIGANGVTRSVPVLTLIGAVSMVLLLALLIGFIFFR